MVNSGFGNGLGSQVQSNQVSWLAAFAAFWLLLVWLMLRSQRAKAEARFASPVPSPALAPLDGQPNRDMHCGCCGYSTTGLESFICPECGSDLRIAGIVPSADRWSLARRLLPGIYFTLVMALVTAMLVSFVDQVLPAEKRYANTIKLTSASAAKSQFTFNATKRTWSSDTSPMPVTIQYRPSTTAPASVTAIYDPKADTLTPAGGTAHPFNFDSMLAWLKSAGVDTATPDVIADAKEALVWTLRASRVRASTITGMSIGGGASQTLNYSVVSATPTGSTTVVILGMAALCYLGLRSLWRKSEPEPDRAFTPSPAAV